jgi:hypothetical protein
MWGRISLLLNIHKKRIYIYIYIYIYNILDEMLLAPARKGAHCNKCVTYLSQQAQCESDARSTLWSISYLTSLKPLDCRGFKNW